MNIIIIIIIIIIICLLCILCINTCKNKNKGGKDIYHNPKDIETNLDIIDSDNFNKDYEEDEDYEDEDYDYEDDDYPTFIVYDITDKYGDHHYIDGQLQYYINGKRDDRKATVNEDGSYSYESKNRRYVIRNNNGKYSVDVYDNNEDN